MNKQFSRVWNQLQRHTFVSIDTTSSTPSSSSTQFFKQQTSSLAARLIQSPQITSATISYNAAEILSTHKTPANKLARLLRQTLQLLTSSCPHLDRVSIMRCKGPITPRESIGHYILTHAAFKTLTMARQLRVESAYYQPGFFPYALIGFDRLQRLDLFGHLTLLGAKQPVLQTLRALHVSSIGSVCQSDDAMAWASQLTALSFRTSDTTIAFLCGVTGLQELHVQSSGVALTSAAPLAGLVNLHTLNATLPGVGNLEAISVLTKLTSLGINTPQQGSYTFLTCLTGLVHLRVCGRDMLPQARLYFDIFSASFTSHLYINCHPHLQSVTLSHYEFDPDCVEIMWLSSLPSLRCLNFHHCDKLESNHLKSLGYFTRLTSLSLRGSKTLTVECVVSMKAAMASLTHLDLAGCADVGFLSFAPGDQALGEQEAEPSAQQWGMGALPTFTDIPTALSPHTF